MSCIIKDHTYFLSHLTEIIPLGGGWTWKVGVSLALNYGKGFPLIPRVLQNPSREGLWPKPSSSPSSKGPRGKRETGLMSTSPYKMLVEIVLRHSWVLCGGWETWEDVEPPWRVKTRSNWTALPMCKQHEDIRSSFCHRSERENFLENKKCFFPLKSTTKA